MTARTKKTPPSTSYRPFAEELALRAAPAGLAVAGVLGAVALASDVAQDTLRAAARGVRDKAVTIGQAVREAQETRLARLRALAEAPAQVEASAAAERQGRDLEARERFQAIQAATALQAAEIEAESRFRAADILAAAQARAAELRASEAPSFADGTPSAPKILASEVAAVEKELRDLTRRDFGPFVATTIADILNGDLVVEAGDDRGAGALAFIVPFPGGERTRAIVAAGPSPSTTSTSSATKEEVCIRVTPLARKLLGTIGVAAAGVEVCFPVDHPNIGFIRDVKRRVEDELAGHVPAPTFEAGRLLEQLEVLDVGAIVKRLFRFGGDLGTGLFVQNELEKLEAGKYNRLPPGSIVRNELASNFFTALFKPIEFEDPRVARRLRDVGWITPGPIGKHFLLWLFAEISPGRFKVVGVEDLGV